MTARTAWLILALTIISQPCFAQRETFWAQNIPSGVVKTFPGWTLLQDTFSTSQSCSGSSCTETIMATKTGSVWVMAIATGNSNVTVTSVTGGGGTWTTCAASACHRFNSGNDNVDLIYNLTGNSGTTSLTANLSGAATGYLYTEFAEFLPPAGFSASFDAAATAANTSCSTACNGAAITVAGTDVVWQFNDIQNSLGPAFNSWSGPYYTDIDSNGLYLNAPAGSISAPTFTQCSGVDGSCTSTSGYATVSAIAFKANFTYKGDVFTVLHYTLNSGSNANGVTCSPTCNITVPSTGTGNLLFLEEVNTSNIAISSISGGGTWVIPSGANTCAITLTSTNDVNGCGYVLSSTSGATNITLTMAANAVCGISVTEISRNDSNPFVLDAHASANNAAANPASGVAVTISGTNDVIFHGYWAPGGYSVVTLDVLAHSPSVGGQVLNGDAGMQFLPNSINGAATSFVPTGTEATAVFTYAFK